MIYGNLQGRLGNRLFIVAATLVHAEKMGVSARFPAWPDCPFPSIKHLFSEDPTPRCKKYMEPSFSYTPIPMVPNLDLHGYFQSAKYHAGYKDLIKQSFAFPDEMVLRMCQKYPDIINNPNAVACHMRFGDYVNIPEFHTNLGRDYYQAAFRHFDVHWTDFVFFSDEPQRVRSMFPDAYVVEGNTDAEDMYLMTRCRGGCIMANSSFSWFGAYLNNSITKKVVSPKNWFGPSAPHDTKDLYCKEWVII